ncbi:MAG TPA: energy-coupling factor transporter ATPase [Acholeplasmataceae bacterium]|jgi:energy-coupling factor transport system ATP-binding protein|nr:energy-coupling factor transporter ATPase [Acholeplasmataceae bacterium]
MVEVKNLDFSYRKGAKVIDSLSLRVEKGEFVTILGHNGSGKSTLAKLLVGLLKADSGEIYIEGKPLNEETVDELRGKIGIVFQNPDNQFVGVTVKDDIAFGLENRRYPREKMLELIEEYSKLVKMEKFLEYNPENLSGGEKQRVAIAGILAYNPDVIIFDEATSMLDPKGVREVTEVINRLKGKKTIIQITHNLSEAVASDRIIVLKEGRIILDGPPKEVFKNKDLLKESRLDILDCMKLIELVETAPNLKNKDELEEFLWELTFQR